MPRVGRAVAALLLVCATVAVGLGCGGGANSRTVATIAGAPNTSITSATLGHWMQSLAGSYFRETVGAQGPPGLVSEPANYRRCIDAAKLVAPRSFFNQLKLSRTQLRRACEELYSSVKTQALGFLITTEWAITDAAEHGIRVTNADVKRAFAQSRGARYPTEDALHRYLTERQWSLSDLLYRLKRELILRKLKAQSPARTDVTGPRQASTPRPASDANPLLARTTCARDALVPECRGYRGPTAATPPPEAVLRRLVRTN